MMFFQRKPKNRRFERDHILDVKLSTQQITAARWRLATRVFGVGFGTVLGLFLLWRGGTWALDAFIFENPAFAVQTLEVSTDGAIPLEQLRKWCEVRIGDNLLALDLARIKRNLELEPWIQEAAVERALPHTLRLRISEREAVAQVYALKPRAAGGGFEPALYFLDGDGCVMPPPGRWSGGAPAPRGTDGLVSFTGVRPGELRPGRPIESEQVLAALNLVQAFERSPMFGRVELAAIDLSTPEILRATTRQGAEVVFALRNLDGQMQRWRVIADAGRLRGKALTSLDLSITNSLPSLWVEASAVTPVAPRPLKPLRARKKNV